MIFSSQESVPVLVLGLCLPDTCSTTDLMNILGNLVEKQNLISNDNVNGIKFTLKDVKDLKDNYYYLMDWKAILTM